MKKPLIIHPQRRVSKHLKMGTNVLSEVDLYMIPTIGEQRFKKVIFDAGNKTQEQIKASVELWVRELIDGFPDYVYHAIRRIVTEGAYTFIVVLKHKNHVTTQTHG